VWGRVNTLEMKKQTEARGQIDQGGDTENDPEMRTSVCRSRRNIAPGIFQAKRGFEIPQPFREVRADDQIIHEVVEQQRECERENQNIEAIHPKPKPENIRFDFVVERVRDAYSSSALMTHNI